jgi:hypothetical protein
MKKNNFGTYLLTGLKGLIVSIVSMIIMILPMWLIRYLWGLGTLEEGAIGGMVAVSALLGVIWILFYFVIWGWLAWKFWRWK